MSGRARPCGASSGGRRRGIEAARRRGMGDMSASSPSASCPDSSWWGGGPADFGAGSSRSAQESPPNCRAARRCRERIRCAIRNRAVRFSARCPDRTLIPPSKAKSAATLASRWYMLHGGFQVRASTTGLQPVDVAHQVEVMDRLLPEHRLFHRQGVFVQVGTVTVAPAFIGEAREFRRARWSRREQAPSRL